MLINPKTCHWRTQNGQAGKLKVVLGRTTCSLILQLPYKTLFRYVFDNLPHFTQKFYIFHSTATHADTDIAI
jgi:hypothetical protein